MRLVTLALLGAALTGCVATRTRELSEAPKSAKQALLNAVGVFDGMSKLPAADALADLEDFQKEGSLKEQDLIDELMPSLDRLTQKDVKIDQGDYRTVLSVMDRMTLLYPDDFDLQLRLTQSMAAVERALGPDSGGSGVTNARLLAARFSGQARAHELLGRLTVESDGALIEAVRSYARCLDLDPSNAKCKDGLKATAKAYTQPKCTVFHKDRLGLYAATEKPAGKTKAQGRKVVVDKQTLYLEREPGLTGADVQEMVKAGDRTDAGVDVILTPRGSARFADLTARLAGKGFLVIMVDGKAKSAPKVMSAVETGRFRLAEAVDMKRLCKKMEGDKLPPDLAGKVAGIR